MSAPITSTTQDHLPIHDIQKGLIILKDGSCAMIIETTAVNFGLLSEQEQDAIIYAYAALLNSLNFQIQILIRSERKDISSYLELLSEAAKKQTSPTKRNWINSYRTFISETVQHKNVLDKKFYIILPFFAIELETIKSVNITAVKRLPLPLNDIVTKADTSLTPKRDHLIKQMERLGLIAHQLTNQELLSLLYRTFNPGTTGPSVEPFQFTTPITEPVIAADSHSPPNPNQPKSS